MRETSWIPEQKISFQAKWSGCAQLWHSDHKVRYVRNICILQCQTPIYRKLKPVSNLIQHWLRLTSIPATQRLWWLSFLWFFVQGKTKSTPTFLGFGLRLERVTKKSDKTFPRTDSDHKWPALSRTLNSSQHFWSQQDTPLIPLLGPSSWSDLWPA